MNVRRRDQRGFTLLELLISMLVVAILAATAGAVYLHQRRKGWMAQVVATTKHLASIQEYRANTAGALGYSSDLGQLTASGFNFSSDDVAPTVLAAGSNAFCVQVSSRHDPAIVWHYSSHVGRPAEGPADPDCVAGITVAAAPGSGVPPVGSPPTVGASTLGESSSASTGSTEDAGADGSGSDADRSGGGDGGGASGVGGHRGGGGDGRDGAGGDGESGAEDGDGTSSDPCTEGDGTDGDDSGSHPSGRDLSDDNGRTQGRSESDPDGDDNGGADKEGGEGGGDTSDQDGNNGSGNDSDFEDDNKAPDRERPAPGGDDCPDSEDGGSEDGLIAPW